MARKKTTGRDGRGKIASTSDGPFHVKWEEDWTDYEAIMKERPDLYAYDKGKKEWRLTEKGEGSTEAMITLWKQQRFAKFPEDRAGGEFDLTHDEFADRGYPII